jgi:hypothetical protein
VCVWKSRLLLVYVHHLYKYLCERTYVLADIKAIHPCDKEEQRSICVTCMVHVMNQVAGG